MKKRVTTQTKKIFAFPESKLITAEMFYKQLKHETVPTGADDTYRKQMDKILENLGGDVEIIEGTDFSKTATVTATFSGAKTSVVFCHCGNEACCGYTDANFANRARAWITASPPDDLLIVGCKSREYLLNQKQLQLDNKTKPKWHGVPGFAYISNSHIYSCTNFPWRFYRGDLLWTCVATAATAKSEVLGRIDAGGALAARLTAAAQAEEEETTYEQVSGALQAGSTDNLRKLLVGLGNLYNEDEHPSKIETCVQDLFDLVVNAIKTCHNGLHTAVTGGTNEFTCTEYTLAELLEDKDA